MEVEVLFITEEITLQGGISDAYAEGDDCLSSVKWAVSFEHRNSFSVFTIKNEE